MGPPQRDLRPLAHTMGDEERVIHPLKLRIRPGGIDAGLKHAAEGRVTSRRGYIERSGGTRLNAGQSERREIPHVYRLDLTIAVAWGQHPAASGDPGQPPGQPANILARPQDHTWPQHHHRAVEGLGGSALTPRLVRAVLRGRPVRLVLRRAGDVRSAVVDRGVFAHPVLRPIRIHRHGGEERIRSCPSGQRPRGISYYRRHIAAGVDDGVPFATAHQTG